MFKYFIKTYNPKSVIFKADRKWTNIKNNIYEKNGFILIRITNPNCYYFKLNKNYFLFENKINNNLIKDWKSMKLSGYHRIYDCGNLIYKYSQHD